MIAGPLRYRLEILHPVACTTASGALPTDFVLMRSVRAERVSFNGRRSEEVGEHFPDYSVRWRIRDAHTIAEGWRVRELGGHTYTVVAIEPNRHRGFITLICERLNE